VTRRLDDADLRLFELLRADASVTLQDLARKLKMPRATVQYRVQKLKELGIIKSISAIPDFSKLGRPILVFILVKLAPPPKLTGRIGRQIAALPGVERVHEVTGEWDVFVEARTGSIESLYTTIDQLRQLRGVAHSMTAISVKATKD
jgi:Lrp/AsnC family transcriptional regulator, leucine-responsive regulatory protein